MKLHCIHAPPICSPSPPCWSTNRLSLDCITLPPNSAILIPAWCLTVGASEGQSGLLRLPCHSGWNISVTHHSWDFLNPPRLHFYSCSGWSFIGLMTSSQQLQLQINKLRLSLHFCLVWGVKQNFTQTIYKVVPDDNRWRIFSWTDSWVLLLCVSHHHFLPAWCFFSSFNHF